MTLTQSPPQPLLAAVGSARRALADVHQVQPLYLSVDEKEALLIALSRLQAQVDELRLRILAVSADIAQQHGTRDVTQWLSRTVHTDPVRLRADEKLARSLDERFPATARALSSGGVNLEQARVIAHCVDDLPDRLGVEVKAQAEADLLGFARDFGPAELRRLGQAILHVSAPDIADAEDARRLEKQEQHAREKSSVRFRPLGDGTTRISMRLSDAVAGRLGTYLDAWTGPRRAGSSSLAGVQTTSTGLEEERLPRHRRLANAFGRLLEHLDPRNLPEHGGDATTVVVTVGIDQLRTGLGAATLDTPLTTDGAVQISAGEARRLACAAGILPAVLGSDSEVLDLGRRRRLFSPAIRKALSLVQKTCAAEGCTVPARWCEAHHMTPWSRGGQTRLKDAKLFCAFDHHRVHDPAYEPETLANGDVRFHRRT
ncbi:DUF222 domain-containing protein [Nocardioides sp. zg-536]|uniref:DUF222 domain-containing protein n=1 Tax=Nocardioides faecalis TaxID=2803858 RepID=A0A938XZ14_9ACTN|nr:HNH endonuclease signature motif containing protein [Nocardioides faecalis]MBM9459107.1 DUF222 domain-containing protein [Nocardioides faecalis]QVI57365.1 DUF222 domain-containing protein [Nocardioides faecalis]